MRWARIAVGATVVLLCVAALEASFRTNPITHAPKVTRALGDAGLVTLHPSAAATLTSDASVVAASDDVVAVAGRDLGVAFFNVERGALRPAGRILELPETPTSIALSGQTAAVT
ncbi:MAG: hypothetical protein FDZ75_01955 [Actinobacteria bacterium]|nr:MAG: hypothetical protein FDZ75_01955 [Actinomycetota bacterium]